MPNIRFLRDFQGVETNNVFYAKGQVVDAPESVASRCVKDGRAELAQEAHEKSDAQEVLITDKGITTEEATENVKKFVEATAADAPVMTTTNQAQHRNKRGH